MKDVFIHVGLHKTASTFLQEKVFSHLTSVSYLTRPYTQHNHAFNKLQYADDSLYTPSELIDALSKVKEDRILISDEALSGVPITLGMINRSMIAKRLKGIFPDAKILLFIRGQKAMLLSHYNMWVKGYYKGYKPIHDFLWHSKKDFTYQDYKTSPQKYDLSTLYFNTNEPYLNLDCFLYYELISLYTKLFRDVHVFLYEDVKTNPANLINRLEDLFGETLPDYARSSYTSKVNKSLDTEELKRKRLDNRLRVLFNNRLVTQPLAKVACKFVGQKYQPNYEQNYVEEFIRKHYAANNQKVIEFYPDIGLERFPQDYMT